jgi:hypothetical protein
MFVAIRAVFLVPHADSLVPGRRISRTLRRFSRTPSQINAEFLVPRRRFSRTLGAYPPKIAVFDRRTLPSRACDNIVKRRFARDAEFLVPQRRFSRTLRRFSRTQTPNFSYPDAVSLVPRVV